MQAATPRASVVFGARTRRAGLCLALLAPLIYLPHVPGAPFLQTAWTGIGALLASAGAWSVDGLACLRGPDRRPIRFLLAAGGVLLGAGLLALPRSTDLLEWRRSMLHLLSWTLLVYAFASEARDPRSTARTVRWLLIAGFGAAGVAVAGALWGAPNAFLLNGQWTGTFGNPNPAGAFAALMYPLCLGAALDFEDPDEKGPIAPAGTRSPAWLDRLPAAAAALVGALLLGTGNRSAWAATLLGGGVTLWVALRNRPRNTAPSASLRGLALAAALSALLAQLGDAPRPGERLRADSVSRSLSVRIRVWSGSLKLALAHPLAGAGPGQFAARFPPYRDPAEHQISGELSSVGDAHNTGLGRLVESGLAGLVAILLGLVGWIGSVFPRRTPVAHAGLRAGLLGSATALAGVACFHDLLPQPALLPGLAAAAALGPGCVGELAGSSPIRPAVERGLGVLLLTATLALVAWAGILPAWAALEAVRAPDLQDSDDRWDRALSRTPDWSEALRRSGRFRDALARRPQDPALWNDWGIQRAREGDLEGAQSALERAVALAPSLFLAWTNLAIVREQRKDVPGALAAYRQAARAPSPSLELAWSAAGLAARHGEVAEAVRWLRLVLELSPLHVAHRAGNDGTGEPHPDFRSCREDPEFRALVEEARQRMKSETPPAGS